MEEEQKRNKEPEILAVLDALQTSNSKYKNADKISLESTSKGNWRVYYDDNDTGVTIQSSVISDNTVSKYGMEYHEGK